MTAAIQQSDLQLPRDQWEAHPNYPRQVLLLGSHESFRELSRALILWAEEGRSPAQLGQVFDYWKSAMAGHEHYEEGKLYPYLEARWKLSCAALRAGHEALARCDAEVRSAVEAGDPASLVGALRAHDEVLDAHLDAEEALVIPALLALTPAEFDAYYNGRIQTLLAELSAND